MIRFFIGYVILLFLIYYKCEIKILLKHAVSKCHEDKNTIKLLYKTVIVLFEKYNIPYVTVCGTLLGIVRDNDIIPWDNDADIIIPEKYAAYAFDILKSNLSNDFNIMYGNGLFACFYKDTLLHIDIYMFRKNEDVYEPADLVVKYYNNALRAVGDKHTIISYHYHHIFPTQKIQWEELMISIPSNPEKILEYEYGKNWKTPSKY